MKLIFAVLDVSLTMGLTGYKTEVFFTFIFAVFVQFYAISIRYTRLKSRNQSAYQISISQSTAEIKLLPVSDDGQPPCWNFTSSFDFDLCACNFAFACKIS